MVCVYALGWLVVRKVNKVCCKSDSGVDCVLEVERPHGHGIAVWTPPSG